ncbi:macrophage mannose receptor C type-1 [Elysia marginata]|uniref:Macrophage mannose receptor C type-1 n=1 Tax=Elysia marginata TaxID=1093978 RepID=A0AAV4HBG3_9GAST|nr:macrophage mannose receptor C type-1 [Elysia marginata]
MYRNYSLTYSNTCENGFEAVGESCYRVSVSSSTWWQAKDDCEVRKASLFHANSPDQEKDLIQVLRWGFTWLGVSKDKNSTALPISPETELNKTEGSGNQDVFDARKSLVCRYALVTQESISTFHTNCNSRFRYVCKKTRYPVFTSNGFAKRQYKSLRRNRRTIPTHCGKDKTDWTWREFKGNCYLLPAIYILRNRISARHACLARGTDLVSITSFEENSFLHSILPDRHSDYWIGLHEMSDGTYGWSDRNPSSYRNFRKGEPNDAGGKEKCVVMYARSGKWNDDSCDKNYHSFICKKPMKNVQKKTSYYAFTVTTTGSPIRTTGGPHKHATKLIWPYQKTTEDGLSIYQKTTEDGLSIDQKIENGTRVKQTTYSGSEIYQGENVIGYKGKTKSGFKLQQTTNRGIKYKHTTDGGARGSEISFNTFQMQSMKKHDCFKPTTVFPLKITTNRMTTDGNGKSGKLNSGQSKEQQGGNSPELGHHGLDTKVIVAVVVGLLIVCALVVLAFLIVRRKRPTWLPRIFWWKTTSNEHVAFENHLYNEGVCP